MKLRCMLVLCSAILLMSALPATATIIDCEGGAPTVCSETVNGSRTTRYFLDQSSWPYSSQVTYGTANIVVNSSTWQTIAFGCDDFGQAQLRATGAFHVFSRASVKIVSAQNFPAGGRFALRIVVDRGTASEAQLSGVTGALTINADGTYRFPMTKVIGGVLTNLPAGNHTLELQARVVDGGSFTVEEILLNAQGTPTSYPAGHGTLSPELTLGTTATQVTPQLTITNSGTTPLVLIPQMYLELTAGTPGEAIPITFELVNASTGAVTPSTTINEYVPCHKSVNGACTFPAGPNNSVTVFGRPMSLPIGTFYLRGKARAASTSAKVDWRYIAYITTPPQNPTAPPWGTYVTNGQGGKVSTTPVTVSTGSADQPKDIPADGVPYTNVLQFSMVGSTAVDENWIGEIYLDFYRDPLTQASWSNQSVDIIMEVEKVNAADAQEFGIWHVTIPPGGSTFTMSTDGLLWGNTAADSTVKVFVRKTAAQSGASFQVNTRYADLKKIPAPGACYVAPEP
jgi:hypothetical protein